MLHDDVPELSASLSASELQSVVADMDISTLVPSASILQIPNSTPLSSLTKNNALDLTRKPETKTNIVGPKLSVDNERASKTKNNVYEQIVDNKVTHPARRKTIVYRRRTTSRPCPQGIQGLWLEWTPHGPARLKDEEIADWRRIGREVWSDICKKEALGEQEKNEAKNATNSPPALAVTPAVQSTKQELTAHSASAAAPPIALANDAIVTSAQPAAFIAPSSVPLIPSNDTANQAPQENDTNKSSSSPPLAAASPVQSAGQELTVHSASAAVPPVKLTNEAIGILVQTAASIVPPSVTLLSQKDKKNKKVSQKRGTKEMQAESVIDKEKNTQGVAKVFSANSSVPFFSCGGVSRVKSESPQIIGGVLLTLT